MKILQGFRYRMYPNSEQSSAIMATVHSCRYVYNRYLSESRNSYASTKKRLSYCQMASDLVKHKESADFLKNADSAALQQSLKHLNAAYANFFRDGKVGEPRFKSRKSASLSYTTPNNVSKSGKGSIRTEGCFIVLPKVGKVRCRLHRNLPEDGRILSATVEKTRSGKFYVSLCIEYENQVIEQTDKNKSIGLDFSMSSLYVASDGTSADMPSFYRRAEKRLKKAQRKLSKMYVKGKEQSRRYRKQKQRVAILHEKAANQRKDFLHKLSRSLVQKYDYICIEDLNMQGMSQSLNFGKSIHDDGWGMFTRMLEYKAAMNGKHVIRIDKFYPSSQTCNVCGIVDGPKALDIREWDCPVCGSHLDRDMNATVNIKNEGLRLAKA